MSFQLHQGQAQLHQNPHLCHSPCHGKVECLPQAEESSTVHRLTTFCFSHAGTHLRPLFAIPLSVRGLVQHLSVLSISFWYEFQQCQFCLALPCPKGGGTYTGPIIAETLLVDLPCTKNRPRQSQEALRLHRALQPLQRQHMRLVSTSRIRGSLPAASARDQTTSTLLTPS